MDALCELIEVVAGVPEQGNHFLQLREVQLHHIPINAHFPNKGREIVCTVLSHLFTNHSKLFRGEADSDNGIPIGQG